MRGGGDVIAIILGIILGFRALYRLFKLKKYLRFTLSALFWFGYPLIIIKLFSFIQQQDDDHIRTWLAMPAVVTTLIWLFFGLMMNKKVENIELNINYKDDLSLKRRIIGFFISILALFAWIAGFNSYFGESEEFDILGSFIISMVFWFGNMYLFTGKPFEKIDD